uniref:DBF4-type domain-containing protein n=1 Tax=Anopheles minimus TaxID=112268 RepID=A0A182VPU5_9DIPT
MELKESVSIEFFLTKDITHFITDKLQQGEQLSSKVVSGETCEGKDPLPSVASPSFAVASSIEKPLLSTHRRYPSVPSPAAATGTPLLQQLRHPQQQQSQRSSRQLLHLTHQQHIHGQYVNDHEPATSRTSSPCPPPITSTTTTVPSSSAAACITTSGAATTVPKQQQQQVVLGSGPSTASTATSVGFDGKVKPIHLPSNGLPAAAVPRSRADAMLQRVRQQQQQHTQYSQQPSTGLLHSSPLNPTASSVTYGSTPTKVSTPSPFQSPSHYKQAPSPNYSPAGAGAATNLGAVTRPTASRQNSPVQLVRSWGTQVWSAEYALKFLRKVLGSLPKENGTKRARIGVGTTDVVTQAAGERHHRHHHHRHNHGSRTSQNVHHLRGPFIKIECRTAPCNYRPVYKEFKRWPVLLRTGKELAGKKAPFADVNEPSPAAKKQPDEPGTGRKGTALGVTHGIAEGTSTSRMTRKLSSTTNAAARTGSTTTGRNGGETGLVKKRTQEKLPAVPPRDCGYCEICRIEYDSLAVHVQSDSHQTFVRNDDNFASLDRLLDSFGGGEGGDTTRQRLEGYRTEEGAVAVEAFFQQLQTTARIKRSAEEPCERRRLSSTQLKVIEAKQERRKAAEQEEEGQRRKTSSTTVKVAVTTTTTAAADELIERQKTPIGDSIANEAAEVKQEQPQQEPDSAANNGNEQLLQCEKKHKGAEVKVKRKFDAVDSEPQCERFDSNLHRHDATAPDRVSDGDDGAKSDSSECGNTTKELIKLAIKSVIASFECSDSEFLADVERTLDDSVRLDESGVQCATGSVKTQVDTHSHPSELGESDSYKCAANSSCNLASRGSSSKPQGQRTTRTRVCKRQTDAEEGTSRGERRSSRVPQLAVPPPVPSAFREVTGTLERSTEASSEGMFGRRSAIHHHPHNQLNHHNHQKHKSTLSALLLKQQQERERQQHQPPSDGSDRGWEEREATASGTVDHAAGMKVLTDFRKQRADDELGPDKSVLLVGPAAAVTPVASSNIVKSPTTVGGGNRRKRNPRPDRPEDAMGLKASTIATSNKHHHHNAHVAHLNDVGGGGGAGGATGGGTKTRHATELAATLLECDGLDPKNTKRISLGLRQNPKRANLNEDFTSLLDETLERTKCSTASTSARRTAQSRIRGPPKGKEQTVTKQSPAAGKVEDETQNHRGGEKAGAGEPDKTRETLEHDRLPMVAGVPTTTKRATGTVSKKAAALEDIKVRGIRWRAPSPTTRPPVKSPLLYKVIDHQAGEESISASDGLNVRISTSSSRTTAATGSRNESSAVAGSVGSNSKPSSNQSRTAKSSTAAKLAGCSPGKKNGLIVKIRRVRQSELSLLNDEAENFMFPRKDDSSSDEDTDDGRQTSSEGFHGAAGNNNFSLDLASSSEGDRGAATHRKEADHHSEEESVLLDDAKSTGVVGSRKRKKVFAATAATRAIALEGGDRLSSPPSPLKTDPSVGPVVKRARLEPSARRKGQLTADYEKGQDPAGSKMRFPEAPIQPSATVAAAKAAVSSTDRLRRRRSQSSASEDKGPEENPDDEEEAKASDDDFEEEAEHKKKRRKGGVTARRRGVQKTSDLKEDTVPDSASLPSPSGLCISCIARSSRGGRGGRGGVAGRRGRRGVRGGVGRGGGRRANRLQTVGASCTCHLLDASRMPPPSSRRRNNESVERAGTPVSQRSSGTRASKTKTTPPNAAAPASSSALASSSLAGGCAIMGTTSMCGSYIKGKEDGMGAVFKWINFRKRCEEIEPYRFAFERVPSLEPWYETFQRQDDGTEKVYEYFGSTGYRKLPYEMGPLPALGQNCCILNYKVIASRKSNRTASLQSSSSASMEPASPSGGKKSGSRLNSSEAQNVSASTSSSAVNESDAKKSSPSSSLSSLPLKKRKLLLQEGAGSSGGSSLKTDGSTGGAEAASHSGRIARLIAGGSERPRKSPREHASTLAILSLLQQQQHRKRAGTIKILTSPKKATTATATQTTALHEQLLHQDADSNGEELSRSCSRASDRGSSRAGSSTGGGIKFDRPLFPDSNYVNSRTLCQELDAFLSDELKRVAGEGSRVALDGIVKKELSECIEAGADEQELLADSTLVANKFEGSPLEHSTIEMPELDQELLPPPSVTHEGIAIERDGLSVSKRDLLDVLQTVGTEPPLSLKLVQRCESVMKKIVQYDRKERSMLASGSGSGLAISSASPVIGLQLFDSGSGLAACGSGTGVGSVGGSFLKKRINRTGWPTNKRKIGTRTRQQSRFMLPALSTAKKSLSRESVKKEEPDDGEGTESKDGDAVLRQCLMKKHDDDEDTDEEDEDDEEDDETPEEEEDRSEETADAGKDGAEDEEDDADTILKEKVVVSPVRCMPRKDVAQATTNEKTDCIRGKGEEASTTNRSEPQPIERRRRKRSFGKSNETRKLNASNRGQLNKASSQQQHTDDGGKKIVENDAGDVEKLDSQEGGLHARSDDMERNTPAYDSMPTLRAALMRDNSQLQRNMASSILLLPSSPSKPVPISPLSTPGSLNRGTVPHSTGRGTPAIGGCESLLCPASTPGASAGQVLGASCCKYITKTTTTMTRVDYDGGGNVTSGGGLPPLKPKHSREDAATNNEDEEPQHHPQQKEDNRQRQSCAPNRSRGATSSSSTAIGSAALATTHDSDDKECDSISSRSIFVSDDCDTTSSSTAINPPDDRSPSAGELPSVIPSGHSNHLPHTEPAPSHSSDVTSSASSLPMNPGTPATRVRRKDSSENEESVQTAVAEAATHNERPTGKFLLANKSTKTPRTPSERIRNKMVKNRRVAIRMELATVASEKQEATTTRDEQTTRTVPSSKRRKSSSLGPPLPPPTVMPLSPPLTTSTSSSSSSSYGADDKAPLSPVGVTTAVRRKTHTDDESIIGDELLQDERSQQHSSGANRGSGNQHNHSAGIVLTPSKIKTRSSTFGHSPAKRTYGVAKLSSKKLPFVSLVKTTFVQTGEIDQASHALVNGTKNLSNKKGNKRKRCKSSVERKASNRSSPSIKKVLKKRHMPEQNVAAPKRKQIRAGAVVDGAGRKRNKKLSARPKQIAARKKLQKSAEDGATSGHFNNNSGTLTNVELEQEEEEDPLSTSYVQESSKEQRQDLHSDEERNYRQHHQTNNTTRVHNLMEEHLIEEEEELLERHERGEAGDEEEDDEEEEELDGMEEEEHYELLELLEVEEQAEEEEIEEVEDEEETHQVEEEEDDEGAFLARDNVAPSTQHQQQQQQQDDEERKLIMADHDYSDQHVDPALVNAEFVEVEELEEDDLECGEETEMDEDDPDEVEEGEEEEMEEDEAEHHHEDGGGDDEDDDDDDDEEVEEEEEDDTTISEDHPRRVSVTAPSALTFGKQQRVKLTYASSSGAASAMAIASAMSAPKTMAASTSAATTKTFNTPTSSPTKYSPRKLRKPRGRWYRER